ncbi:MAG: YihY family inner membrane protein [Pseudomonadota bacterium]|jgi:membrane protein
MSEPLASQAEHSAKSEEEVLTKAKRKLGFGIEELKWVGRVLISSADRFYWDNGFSKAASLAYSSLLSLVPLTALCFGIMATFISTGDHMTQVKEFLLKQFMPGTSAFDSVLPLIEQFSAKLTSLNYLVIAALIATCLLLLNSIEYTLNQVWQVYEARRITDRLAIFCAIIVLVPVFAVSGYYTSTKVEPFFADFGLLSGLYQDFIPFMVDSIAFVALYYLVPKAPVKFVPAIFGGCAASLLFGLAKHWFAFYLVRFSTYERVYESLALIPIFLIWLYVSWSIVLFGAEICYQAQHLPRRGKLWTRTLMSIGDGAMLLAMQSLVLVSRAFVSGKRIPNELEIAEALGCSSVVLKGSLDSLERAGIIIRGDGRDMPLLLMKSPDAIMLEDIREALFKKRESMFFGKEMSKLYHYFAKDPKRGRVSLMDLINEGEG